MANFMVCFDLHNAPTAHYQTADRILEGMGLHGSVAKNGRRYMFPNTTYLGELGSGYEPSNLRDVIASAFQREGLNLTRLLVGQVSSWAWRDAT